MLWPISNATANHRGNNNARAHNERRHNARQCDKKRNARVFWNKNTREQKRNVPSNGIHRKCHGQSSTTEATPTHEHKTLVRTLLKTQEIEVVRAPQPQQYILNMYNKHEITMGGVICRRRCELKVSPQTCCVFRLARQNHRDAP